MDLQTAIRTVVDRKDLGFEAMREVMTTIMTGDATPAQIAGLLIGLRMKGETIDEIAAAATVMRSFAAKVEVNLAPLIDTCGTGGDGIGTFNISTASAFVAAAAGGYIAKHGNRAASSKSGSADLLEAAGARIDLTPSAVAACIAEVGVGFMFAPAHHGATRHAAGPRRELGTRTLFNVLGPLTNPASADRQLMGVFEPAWVPRAAQVLRRLGVARAMVVCAADGMDEISIGAETFVAELNGEDIQEYQLNPERFGIELQDIGALSADDPKQSLSIVESVYAGDAGPARDIVCLNAGAAIYVGGLSESLEAGVDKARAVIDEGKAAARFKHFVSFTQTVS
ncbi:MAG: anthranilate phosphoribosyltransferase [Gammaproteobacteria bacterium]